jgi:hypothetical protein
MGKRTPQLNQDTRTLDKSHDCCAGCGTRIPAGDVYCRTCE